MTTFYLSNAFSLNMLERLGFDIALRPIHVDGVRNLLRNEKWKSIVGHPDTAAVLSSMLGVEVVANRATMQFGGDYSWSLIVAQYTGERLPPGATELPTGAKIEFWQVYPQ